MDMGRKKKEKKEPAKKILDGCDCLNCRLGRIEIKLNQIQTLLESSGS